MQGRLRRSLRSLIRDYFGFPLVAFIYGLVVLSLGTLAWQGEWMRFATWLFGAAGIAAVVYVVIFAVMTPAKAGVQVAMDVRRASLGEQGWGSLWTESEYRKLQPESSKPRFAG